MEGIGGGLAHVVLRLRNALDLEAVAAVLDLGLGHAQAVNAAQTIGITGEVLLDCGAVRPVDLVEELLPLRVVVGQAAHACQRQAVVLA